MPRTSPELKVRVQAMLRPTCCLTRLAAREMSSPKGQCHRVCAVGLVPRMLVGAVRQELLVDMFGLKLSNPLFMAPIGVPGLCAQDGPW